MKCPECGSKVKKPLRGVKKFCASKCRLVYWVKNNRERLNKNVREYRRRRFKEDGFWRDSGPKARKLKAWMVEIKSEPCLDCGGKFPTCCMDFDHRNGTKKKFDLGSMFAHHYSRKLIRRELKKCDLVCANCHRIRTRNRNIGHARNH